MTCKRFLFGLGVLLSATLPAFAAPANIQEATYWLEGKSQQLVRQSRAATKDGTAAFAPQAGPIAYDAFWLRDYAYMLEGCPEAFTAEELKNSCRTFINALSPAGVGVDCVKFGGTPCYKPGYGSLGANPVADGSPFTVDVAWRTYRQTKDAALVGQMIDKLVLTMNAVPRDPNGNGLVYIDPKAAWDRCPWGFTDGVRKTGDELMCSLLDVRASRELADLLDVVGRTGEAVKWRAAATRKTASIRSVFWDAKTGLFNAATVKCRQPDIMGSAYAVELGVATAEQATAIANYFNANYDAIVKDGQVRHLPGGVYWQDTISGQGQYQNGMFWGVASGWVASTLSRVNPTKGRQMLLDMVGSYQARGVNEYVNSAGVPSGVGNYVASATMPLVLLKQLCPVAAQPELTAVGGTLTPATDVALAANGGRAFAKNVIPGYSDTHTIAHLNDGIYGNANSWIGNTTSTFAGVAFNRPQTIASLAFGRDNMDAYHDRYKGMYLLQYTRAANPDANTADAQWTSFGSFALDGSDAAWGNGSGTNLRHVYRFEPISGVTGVRILLDTANGDTICIDELEVYSAGRRRGAAQPGSKGIGGARHRCWKLLKRR